MSCVSSEYPVIYVLGKPTAIPLVTSSITYSGPNLVNINVNHNDNLNVVLQKIDYLMTNTNFVNKLIQAISSDPTLKSNLCSSLNC